MKIEVKQVDHNYDENQYLYVDKLWINVGHNSAFHDFQFEGSIGNKITCTQDIPYLRGSYLIRLMA